MTGPLRTRVGRLLARRLGDEADLGHGVSRGPRQAQLDGFDLHANVWVPPNDRARLEQPGRYLLRTPLAQDRVQLRADGRILATRSAQGSQAHIDELQGGVLAIQAASREVAEALIAEILQTVGRDGAGRAQQITLIISGLVSYRHLAFVQSFLEREIQGVTAVQLRQFTQGTAELALDYAGRSSLIAGELANQKFTGFRLEPTDVTANKLEIRAVLDR